MTKARRRRREEKRRFLSVNSPALSPTTSAHSSTMRKKKRSIRTSAVAFAKIAIPLSFAPFASRTFLATFNFVNRLVSNDDENEEEEEEDVAEDAMRVFEDFLCERANCEQEMCVDAVVDANMFVFDRDVYVFGLFVVVNNFTRSDWKEGKCRRGFGVGFFFDPNTRAAFFNNFSYLRFTTKSCCCCCCAYF